MTEMRTIWVVLSDLGSGPNSGHVYLEIPISTNESSHPKLAIKEAERMFKLRTDKEATRFWGYF